MPAEDGANVAGVGPRLSTKVIAKLADGFGPILVLAETEDGAWGFLLGPGKAAVIARKLKFSSDSVDSLLELLGAEKPFDKPAKTLWRDLIAPFWQEIHSYGSLSVVPLGSMSRIPFSVLMDEQGGYLFQEEPLSIAPSLKFLANLEIAAGTAPTGKLTILSGTIRSLSLQVEKGLQSAYPGANQIATTANFKNYAMLAPDSRILVMATHGVAEDGPSGSYLQIAATPDHDSHFRAFEIAETPLKAELVALVVCDAIQGAESVSSRNLDLASFCRETPTPSAKPLPHGRGSVTSPTQSAQRY